VNFRVIDYWVHVVLLSCFIVAVIYPATLLIIFSIIFIWQVISLILSKFLGIFTPAKKKYAIFLAVLSVLWLFNSFYPSILMFALILANILLPFWYFRIIKNELDEDHLN
jgi:hypothetical protein